MKIKYAACLLIIFSSVFFAQDLNKVYKKIENKLKSDQKYLNIFAIGFTPNRQELANFKNIPLANGKEFNLDIAEGQKFEFVILEETMEVDSTILLYVRRIVDRAVSGEAGFFGAVTGESTIDTTNALSFKDVQELYFNHRDVYEKLLNKVKELLELEEANSQLRININENIQKSKGISAKDNVDFLNFAWVNSDHRFPKPPVKSGFRGGEFVRPGSKSDVKALPMQFSVDFGKITFYHADVMNFDFSQTSFELNTSSKLLNLHPWQSMSVSFGLRTLIFLTQDIRNMNNDFIIDAKIMGRFGIDMSSISSSIPFIFVDKPKLNIGSGLELDISTTRAFDLPFLNIYFSTGSEDITNPFVKFGRPDSSVAYFSFTQWAASFSFFWNTSETRNLRLRMDVGVGRYNVVRGLYYKGTSRDLVFNKIQPLIQLYINFVPKDSELFAASIRWFDSIIKLDFWLKLLDFGPEHVVRFEASHMSAPLYRSFKPWENDGSTMVGLKYRYGF